MERLSKRLFDSEKLFENFMNENNGSFVLVIITVGMQQHSCLMMSLSKHSISSAAANHRIASGRDWTEVESK